MLGKELGKLEEKYY